MTTARHDGSSAASRSPERLSAMISILCIAAVLSACVISQFTVAFPVMFSAATERWSLSGGCIYLLIFCSAALCLPVCRYVFKRTTLVSSENSNSIETQHGGSNGRIYGLEHGILNLELPPKTMWMNMGYWKDQAQPSDFPSACRALLEEVLRIAGITDAEQSSAAPAQDRRKVKFIDVGFGCGDQSIYLAQMDCVSSYVGITIEKKQFRFAQQRLSTLGILGRTSPPTPKQPIKSVEIFCADAAVPQSWNEELKHASSKHFNSIAGDSNIETWLLALDVLYHFSPSRQPIFNYAFHQLHASIMAYDLLLPDAAGPSSRPLSPLERLLLFAISFLTFTPYSNFLTPEQYRAQLVSAGYASDEVVIHDISKHVFAPLVAFLEERDTQLRMMGKGIGVFHMAKWIFGWWARSGVLRGCIVIARKTQ